jgi:hypothetical protein
LTDTVLDTYHWDASFQQQEKQDMQRVVQPNSLRPEREVELLTAWRNQNGGS